MTTKEKPQMASIDFDDKRKAADGLISTIKATSDRVQIEWKI